MGFLMGYSGIINLINVGYIMGYMIYDGIFIYIYIPIVPNINGTYHGIYAI